MKLEIKPIPVDMDHRAIVRLPGIKYYEDIIDGHRRTWEEYIPTGYNGQVSVPLLIDVHGGNRHTESYMRPWMYIAERENFIVLYPHSIVHQVTWNVFNHLGPETGMPDDVRYFDLLLEKIYAKYNIDKSRIYIHGQSMGDMMVTTYLRERANIFAAAAPLSGPAGPINHVNADGSLKLPVAPLPVLRTHGSLDLALPLGSFPAPAPEALKNRDEYNGPGKEPAVKPAAFTDENRKDKMELHELVNNRLWLERNNLRHLPKLTLRDQYSLFIWPGRPYDFIYLMIENGEHGPKHNVYDLIWKYFFSAYKRSGDHVVRTTPEKAFACDTGAVVVADGADNAYVDNHLLKMSRPAKDIQGTLYVPLDFLDEAFPNVVTDVYHKEEIGMQATIRFGKKVLQIATGCRTALLDQEIQDMDRVLLFDSSIYVPLKDVSRILLGLKSSSGRGITYVADHTGDIGYDFSYLVKSLLGVITEPTNLALRDKELEKVSTKS